MDRHDIETDFLIAGGGMAGVCAAISAARNGIKVVLVQDRSVLGGNASSEVRMHIVGADCSGGRKGWRESGLIEELRLEDTVRNPERCYPFWDVILYEKVTAEPNITLLLDTDVVGVEMEQPPGEIKRPARTERMYEFRGPESGRIKSIRAVRQLTQDEFIIRAKLFADCTGDGRLGFEAGADFRIGRESKEMHGETLALEKDDTQTLGSSILITSRKTERPVPFVPPPWARKFSPDLLRFRPINSFEYGFWWVEWGGQLDTIKDNCTTIRHELYKIALGIWDYVKNSGKYPQSENWTLDWIGAIPGKRESRRFLGPHILVEQDVLESRVHDDEVALGGWAVDLHPPSGVDAVGEPPYTPTRGLHVYGIPLRCYYSRNIENLFFAGRNISATHVAFASTRVMATCSVGGQAVGTAAAWCVQHNLTPSRLSADKMAVSAFQQHLLQQDATLPSKRLARNAIEHAKITASSSTPECPPSNVFDGWTRDELTQAGKVAHNHAWQSEPLGADPQWLRCDWDAPVEVREIHLTFDSGFTRPLMLTPSDTITKKTVRGPQPETIRDYQIELDGKVVANITGNYQRKRVHRLEAPVPAKDLTLRVTATNGAPAARLFDLRVY